LARRVLGAGLLVSALGGCGLAGSGEDAGRLEVGIEELASVGGPAGQEPTSVSVMGCDDDAEMPMGIATFSHAGPDDGDVDALNAELDRLSEWYEQRWSELGWTIQAEFPEVSKELDGERLRAAVDAVTSTQYSVVVVQDGAAMCS
jgi:hypothetical protein